MNKIKKICICHYTPLKERKEYMIKQCKKYDIYNKLIFLEKFDREKIPVNLLNLFDENKLKKCEISLFLKHIHSMGKIMEDNYGIILEDDTIFKDNFIEKFNNILMKIPENFDILYTGVFPFYNYYKKINKKDNPIPKNAKKFGNLYEMKNTIVFPWTGNNKGTDFYIISKKCCKMFLEYFKKIIINKQKINLPIDHFMGQFLYNKKANVYWSDEEITIHGSWGEGFNKNAFFKNSMGH